MWHQSGAKAIRRCVSIGCPDLYRRSVRFRYTNGSFLPDGDDGGGYRLAVVSCDLIWAISDCRCSAEDWRLICWTNMDWIFSSCF